MDVPYAIRTFGRSRCGRSELAASAGLLFWQSAESSRSFCSFPAAEEGSRCSRCKLLLIINTLLTDQLATFSHQLAKLTNQLQRDKSTNHGGRFEWVDSLLVHALQAGHWLLIDNANFCR